MGQNSNPPQRVKTWTSAAQPREGRLGHPGSPPEPAPAPGLASWAAAQTPESPWAPVSCPRGGTAAWQGPRWPGARSRAETPLCGLRGAGEGMQSPQAREWAGLGPLRPLARTVVAPGAKLSLILGKTSAGKEGVERGGERRGRSIGARSSTPHLSRRLLASQQMAGGGGRGCSRRVSRVTTPMKFPIVGGGDEAAVAAPPFSSSAAPPRRSHLMSFPVDPPGGLPVESVGVGAPKPPACPPNNTPLPAPRGSGRGEGREALQRPFYV